MTPKHIINSITSHPQHSDLRFRLRNALTRQPGTEKSEPYEEFGHILIDWCVEMNHEVTEIIIHADGNAITEIVQHFIG